MPLQYISQGNKILKWLRQLFVKENKRLPIGNEIEKIKTQATNIDNAFAKAASQGSKVEVNKENINFIVSKLKQDKIKAAEAAAIAKKASVPSKTFLGKTYTDDEYIKMVNQEIADVVGPAPTSNVIDIKSKLPVNAPGFPDHAGLARQTLEKNPGILESFLLQKKFPRSHKTGIHDVPIVKQSEWDLSVKPRKRAEDTTSVKNFTNFAEGLFNKDEIQKIMSSGQASDVAYVMDTYGMSRDSVMAKINRGDKLIEDLRGMDEFADGGRIGLFAGKSPKILLGLKSLSNKIAPGSTDIGKTSKTVPSGIQDRRELRQSISDFNKRYETQEAKKRFNRKFQEFVNLNGRGPETPQEWGSLRKADGGRIGLMYGGDPGFAFEYGGSWADWRDQHQHQMPVEDYLEQKLPKERLPFRDTEYADGGITRVGYAAGKIVKGGRWFLNNLRKALKDLDAGKWKELDPKNLDRIQKEGLTSQIKTLIKNIEEGGPIPDEMIQTIRSDPKFAEVSKIRSTDPDLYEFEDVILNYGKKGDVVDEQIKILEKFTPKSKGHATGGIAHMLGERDDEVYSAGGGVGRPPIGSGVHAPDTTQQQPTPIQMGKANPPMMGGMHPGMMRGHPGMMGSRMPMINPHRPNHMFNTPMIQPSGIHRIRNNPFRTQAVADGGRIGFSLGGMSRRAFLKLMSGLAALPFVGKGVQKAAPKAIKEVTETITRDSGGIPSYAFDLIEVVKAKGAQEIVEGVTKKVPAKKYSYKGVDVTEHPNGLTEVRKQHTGPASWTDETGDVINDDAIHREVGFDIQEGGYEQIGNPQFDDAAKTVKLDDEYFEATVRPDADGKMKDMEEFIEEADHLDLKKIADEATTEFEKFSKIRNKKASGGLAHMVGE